MRIREILGEEQKSLWGEEPWPLEIGPRDEYYNKKSNDKLNMLRNLHKSKDIDPEDFKQDDDDNHYVGRNHKNDAIGVTLPGRLSINQSLNTPHE